MTTTSPALAAEPTSLFDPRVREAAIAILLIVALSAFEGLAVIAALPQVAASLGSVALLPWVITSYLLTSGVTTVAAGALLDRHGVAPVFRAGVIVFVVGGVLAGFAPTMPWLVAARVIQGAGAGVTGAVGLTAVGLVFPRRLISRAFAANSNVWGIMSVAGPAIAAAMLAVASWRWIFLINLPLGAVALALGWRAFPTRPADEGPHLPLRGFDLALLALFNFGVLYAVDALGWRSLPAAIAALGCFALVLHRNRGEKGALLAPRHAIGVPLGPLGWTIALILAGVIGLHGFVPLYVAGGRGAPGLSAWSVLFFVLGWTVGSNLASRAIERGATPLRIITLGATLVPVALAACGAAASAHLHLGVLFACLAATGAGTGSATNSGLTLLRSLVTDAELGRATASHQFVRNLGFAVGNALFGAVLLLVVGNLVGDVEQIRTAIEVDATGPIPDAIQSGFATAALVCAAVATLAHVPLWFVRRHLARQA